MSTLKYWIWLAERRGLRGETRQLLLEHFDDPRSVYFAGDRELEALGLRPEERESLEDKSLERMQTILRRCTELDVQLLTIRDAQYPNRLRNIYDPPLLLYVLGRLPAVDEYAAIAIVGTRKATPYGVKMGRRMGYELTKGGALVISGLAEGVDSAGALGALRAGGSCIGVLGTGIDQIYPSFNRELFEDVRTVGALVSEYPPASPMQRGSFPRRNRILSGLSCGVVVIEAPEKSGALITAARALEQGRDLFVVPGNADSPSCAGSNALLKDCAKAVTNGGDVLCEYSQLFSGVQPGEAAEAAIPQEGESEPPAPETPDKKERDLFRFRSPKGKRKPQEARDTQEAVLRTQLEGLSEKQLKLVAAIPKPETHIDEIIQNSGLPAGDALAEMTMLEIQGVVTQTGGKRFSLNIRRG